MAEPQPGVTERVLHARRTALSAAGKALSRPARAHRHRHPHRSHRLRRRDDAVLGSGGFPAGRRATQRGRATSDAKRASCEAAERAIFRYSKWPTQAITYRLGKDADLRLREEASKQLGATLLAKRRSTWRSFARAPSRRATSGRRCCRNSRNSHRRSESVGPNPDGAANLPPSLTSARRAGAQGVGGQVRSTPNPLRARGLLDGSRSCAR